MLGYFAFPLRRCCTAGLRQAKFDVAACAVVFAVAVSGTSCDSTPLYAAENT